MNQFQKRIRAVKKNLSHGSCDFVNKKILSFRRLRHRSSTSILGKEKLKKKALLKRIFFLFFFICLFQFFLILKINSYSILTCWACVHMEPDDWSSVVFCISLGAAPSSRAGHSFPPSQLFTCSGQIYQKIAHFFGRINTQNTFSSKIFFPFFMFRPNIYP